MNHTTNINDEIKNAKFFLLRTCPIDELPNGTIKDIVIGFRLNHISILDAFRSFSIMEVDDFFREMVGFNRFMNALVSMEEQ
jgi:hypothetical protein